MNKKNLIVLTTGSSGSSVLTGLIAKQGFWLGENTKKLNFDTYENAELVDLNMQILKLSGFNRRDCNDIPSPSIPDILAVKEKTAMKPFRDFMDKCSRHEPWVWKDPRLAYTIHFWAQFKDVLKADFVFIDRNPEQSYSGLILSRKINMSFREQNIMNANYRKSCDLFGDRHGLPLFECLFEELILNPGDFIQKLNVHLGLKITLEDLKSIYKGRLYRERYGKIDFFKAKLWYFLNRYGRKDFVSFPRGKNG